ncbi:hypothetical protein ACQW5G_04465 [Fructilactobacillus sp. Tb1]|uniref:hypothetical protein n=1 Tax=Fructilactobacillus sp. Tb1 TaxID=3422304 RepID=UPI003D27ED40
MAIEEPVYRSISIGMVKVGVVNNGGQIIANVIGNNVIAINKKVQRATVTGPDRTGTFGIGDYVYFTTDKNKKHNIMVQAPEVQEQVAN